MANRIPLALLPGLLNDRALWAQQIEALADIAEYRVAGISTQDSLAGMARAIPNASLVVIEDCGHLSPMERPEEVALALRGWLAAW